MEGLWIGKVYIVVGGRFIVMGVVFGGGIMVILMCVKFCNDIDVIVVF